MNKSASPGISARNWCQSTVYVDEHRCHVVTGSFSPDLWLVVAAAVPPQKGRRPKPQPAALPFPTPEGGRPGARRSRSARGGPRKPVRDGSRAGSLSGRCRPGPCTC